jgi:hypothetical protein
VEERIEQNFEGQSSLVDVTNVFLFSFHPALFLYFYSPDIFDRIISCFKKYRSFAPRSAPWKESTELEKNQKSKHTYNKQTFR